MDGVCWDTDVQRIEESTRGITHSAFHQWYRRNVGSAWQVSKTGVSWSIDFAVFYGPKLSENALRKSALDYRLATNLSGDRRRAGYHDL